MARRLARRRARSPLAWGTAALAFAAALATPQVSLGAPVGDYGHAPDNAHCQYLSAPAQICHFRTKANRDGPIHGNPVPIHLGSTVDTESAPDPVLGDVPTGGSGIAPRLTPGDDDGFAWNLKACAQSTVTFAIDATQLPHAMLTSSHTAFLNAWFDWNKGGTFTGGSRCGGRSVPKWGVQNVPVTLDQLAPTSGTLLVSVPLTGGEQVKELWLRATLTLDHKLASVFEMQGGGKFTFGETEDYLIHEGPLPQKKQKKQKKQKQKKKKNPLAAIWCGNAWLNDDPGSSAVVWMGANFLGPYQIIAQAPPGSNYAVTASVPGLPGFIITPKQEFDSLFGGWWELNWVDVQINSPDFSLADRIWCPVWIWHDQDFLWPEFKWDIGSPNLNDPANTKETFQQDVVKYWLGLGPKPEGYEDYFEALPSYIAQASRAHAARARAAPQPTARAAASPSASYGGVSSPVTGEVLSVAIKGTVRPSGASGEPLLQGNGGVFSLAHIQVLRPQPDGSMTVISTSGGFNMPVGGNPEQVTVVHPFNMCIQKGDEVDFNWEGGYDPFYYPNGVAMQVFSSMPGPSIAVYSKHNGTMNGANFHGKEEPNTELLMQAQIGTGPAASSNCPGGTGPSQHAPPPGTI
jgi:GEVED domain